jgi:hypothetical protein
LAVVVWYVWRGGWAVSGSSPIWMDGRYRTTLERRGRRRRLGLAVMGLVAAMFCLGLAFLDPQAAPRSFLLFWLVVSILLVWLCWLAVSDVLMTWRLKRQLDEQTHAHIQRLIQAQVGADGSDREQG